jgi:hypothetical protein
MRPGSALPLVAIALLLACRTGNPPAQAKAPATDIEPADSLVATNEEGVEIWFTLARVGRAANGSTCVERGLEIRRGGARIAVPLLYTGAAPILLDRSTMRAELWNHCRKVDTYLVDLQSGRPVRQSSRTAS